MTAGSTGAAMMDFRGVDGLRLVGDFWGTRAMPLAVLLHGAGQTRQSWRRTGARLAASGVAALALDSRGHGDSDWAPDGDYRLSTLAEDVIAVLQQIDRPVALVGASIGGLAGIRVAAHLGPLGVSRLAMIDVVPRFEAASRDRVRGFMTGNRHGFATLEEVRDAIAAYAPSGRAGSQSADGVRRIVRQRAGRWYWHWDPAFANRPADESEHSRRQLEELAARLTIPVLTVRGTLSDVVSKESAEAFRRAAPAARFVELSGVGHGSASQTNDGFDDAIADFIVCDQS